MERIERHRLECLEGAVKRFLWGYTLTPFLGGVLADKIGGKNVLLAGIATLRHVGSASLPRNATGCAHEPRSRSGWFTDTVRRTFAGFASVSR